MKQFSRIVLGRHKLMQIHFVSNSLRKEPQALLILIPRNFKKLPIVCIKMPNCSMDMRHSVSISSSRTLHRVC